MQLDLEGLNPHWQNCCCNCTFYNTNLRLVVPLVSFGTPWPNKLNHKTLHFHNFLSEIFNAASIKVTVFKIKSNFTEYSSVISSLLIILTEICIFSNFFKQMHVLQKQTEICIFQHAFHIQLNVDTYFIVILKCFWINKRTTKFISFLKFKLLVLALVGGVFQDWITFSQCPGLYVET